MLSFLISCIGQDSPRYVFEHASTALKPELLHLCKEMSALSAYFGLYHVCSSCIPLIACAGEAGAVQCGPADCSAAGERCAALPRVQACPGQVHGILLSSAFCMCCLWHFPVRATLARCSAGKLCCLAVRWATCRTPVHAPYHCPWHMSVFTNMSAHGDYMRRRGSWCTCAQHSACAAVFDVQHVTSAFASCSSIWRIENTACKSTPVNMHRTHSHS